MRSNIDPDMLLSVFQRRDNLSGFGEIVSNERLTAMIFDALPDELYPTIKVQSIRDPD